MFRLDNQFFDSGVLSPDSLDAHLFKLLPGSYIFSISTPFSSEVDLALRIADKSGRVLSFSDKTPGSFDPLLRIEVSKKGTYALEILNQAIGDGLSDVFYELSAFNLAEIDSVEFKYSPVLDPITGVRDLGVKSAFRSAISDDIITKPELQKILRSAASDDDTVSKREFKDLRIISANLDQYLKGRKGQYYQQIYDNIVLGNPANNFWTGGSTQEPSKLGFLRPGSPSHLLDRLIDKWFLGRDLPNPFMPGDAAANAPDITGVYLTASGNLFGDSILFSDVNQGRLGDCWLMASAASVAAFKPRAIKKMFIDNKDGTFGVRLYELNAQGESVVRKPHWVTVNLDLPTADYYGPNTLAGAAGSLTHSLHGGILWISLFEKAVAQASEIGIFAKTRPDQVLNSYASIQSGFDYGIAMIEATDMSVANWDTPLEWYSDSGERSKGSRLVTLDSKSSWDEFVSSYRSNTGPGIAISVINLNSEFLPWVSDDASGLRTMVANHALAIVDFDPATDTFTIYNPWGLGANPLDNPGINVKPAIVPFSITSDELYKYFLVPMKDAGSIWGGIGVAI